MGGISEFFNVLQGCNTRAGAESYPARTAEAPEITSQSAGHHPLPHQKEFPVSHQVSSLPSTPAPSHTHQLTDSNQRRNQDDNKHKSRPSPT